MPTYPEVIEDPYHFQNLIGFEMVEWTAENVILHLKMREALTNRYGLPHGGLHATLLDTAMGYSGCFTGNAEKKAHAMTLTLVVNYLSRPKGELLIAEAEKVGGGKRTFFSQGKVTDETGELIATANGTFRYRSN